MGLPGGIEMRAGNCAIRNIKSASRISDEKQRNMYCACWRGVKYRNTFARMRMSSTVQGSERMRFTGRSAYRLIG